MAGGCAHETGAPDYDYACCHAFDRPALGHEYGRVGTADEAQVEDGGAPAVAHASVQAEIFAETEESLVSVRISDQMLEWFIERWCLLLDQA